MSDSSESDGQPSAFTPRQRRNNRRHARRFAELRDLLERRLQHIRAAETLLTYSPLQEGLGDPDKVALVKAIRVHVRAVPKNEDAFPPSARHLLGAIGVGGVALTAVVFGPETILGLLAFSFALAIPMAVTDWIDGSLRSLYGRGLSQTVQDNIVNAMSYAVAIAGPLLMLAVIPLNDLIDASMWSQYSFGQTVAIGTAVAPVLLMVIPFVCLSVVVVIDNFNTKRRLREVGRVAAVYELLAASSEAEYFGSIRSATPAHRVSRHLRRAAHHIRHDMPYRLELPSATQTIEYRSRCDAVARHVECYAYELFSATEPTITQVRLRLVRDAVALARFHDGEIEGVPTGPFATRRFVHRVLLAIRATIIGALPATALFALDRLQIEIPESIAGVAVIVAIVWSLVTLLMLIDPELPDRVKSTSGLLSLLRGNPPGGDKP
ncbi:hypothetical protein [Pseudonocardia sp. DLS-67]